MLRKHLRLGNRFLSHDLRDIRMVLVEKRSEAIEVGERVSRPFHLHGSRQGRKAGVPQVRSQRTTFSWDTVPAPASTAAHRRSSSAISEGSTVTGSRSMSTS